MGLFRKKPVEVEARYFDGSHYAADHLYAWMGNRGRFAKEGHFGTLTIPTLEGDMIASRGDWIIKGVKGEFYPCKPDIFAATYEPVSSEAGDQSASVGSDASVVEREGSREAPSSLSSNQQKEG